MKPQGQWATSIVGIICCVHNPFIAYYVESNIDTDAHVTGTSGRAGRAMEDNDGFP